MIEKIAQKEEQKFYEEIVSSVESEFKKRQTERFDLERQWELNMNFLNGNQYCKIDRKGEIVDTDKDFYWQNMEVFNHVAPIIESRIAKFNKIEPKIAVRSKTDDDKDVDNAFVAEQLILSAFEKSSILDVVKKSTLWSETCGTGFYKIIWNNAGGNKVGVLDGKEVFEGEVEILSVSPFEIFPDNLYVENIEDLQSIIHARAMPVSLIKEKYGISIAGEDVDVYGLYYNDSKNRAMLKEVGKGVVKNSAIVIEKYEKPSSEFPNGRLITVAGGKLLYYGELPYYKKEENHYYYPFVKQESVHVAGSFFGSSVIERLIPIQRAYNAVKNRKHEFLNRLSMGIMTVEDGSVDVDDLAEEGLSPGKILVYRQGSNKPEMMDDITMPSEFNDEEEKLLTEFVAISGVSDVTQSKSNTKLSSATALQLWIEQDNERLLPFAERIRSAYLEIARQTLALYTEFLTGIRVIKYKDNFDKTKICYADKDKVKAEEVYLESENELLFTPLQKKELVFRLLETGLLNDEEGKIRQATKEKILGLLGYKDLDYQKGISRLQEEKAQYENVNLKKNSVEVEEIDDHEIHIEEHTRYVLCEYVDLSDQMKERFYEHIKCHKNKILEKKEIQNDSTK